MLSSPNVIVYIALLSPPPLSPSEDGDGDEDEDEDEDERMEMLLPVQP